MSVRLELNTYCTPWNYPLTDASGRVVGMVILDETMLPGVYPVSPVPESRYVEPPPEEKSS